MLVTGASLLSLSIYEGFVMRKLVSRFVKNDEGAALVEYGLLVGLIAVVCLAAVQTLGNTINAVFTNIDTNLTAALGL